MAPAGTASASDPCNGAGACVVVAGAGDLPPVPAATVAQDADVPPSNYDVPRSDPETGESISSFLSNEGITLGQNGHVDIETDQPEPAQLTYAAVENSSSYYQGGLPPILVTNDPGELGFIRNKHDARDNNAAQYRIPTTGSETLTVFGGPILKISISAPSNAQPGSKVWMTASVTNDKSATPASYTWNFGDGSAPVTVYGNNTVGHVFDKPSTYPISLEVDGNDDSDGFANADVTVGHTTSPTGSPSPGGGSKPGPGPGSSPSPSGSPPPTGNRQGHGAGQQQGSGQSRHRGAGSGHGLRFRLGHMPRIGKQMVGTGVAPYVGSSPEVAAAPEVRGQLINAGHALSLEALSSPQKAQQIATAAVTPPRPVRLPEWIGIAAAVAVVLAGAGRELRKR